MNIPPRVIPVLQLSDGFLVKTRGFSKAQYIGDPINAVKIFNDKRVDELIICDIDASKGKESPNFRLLEAIASEAFMPVGYGGGIRKADDALRVFSLGMEKVLFSSALRNQPLLIEEIVALAGSQSVVASIDVRRTILGKAVAYVDGGRTSTGEDPITWAQRAVSLGVGEVIVSSIDRDGTSSGFDLDLIEKVAASVSVPIVALGGARGLNDFSFALDHGASAVAAGSFFVFHGKHRAVLITYPTPEDIQALAKGRE